MLAMDTYGAALHDQAPKLSRRYRETETALIEVLLEILERKIYRCLGRASLFDYIIIDLKLSRSVAYGFWSVTKKAMEIPELMLSLREDRMSLHTATRLSSAINAENAEDLIAFAESHSASNSIGKSRALSRERQSART